MRGNIFSGGALMLVDRSIRNVSGLVAANTSRAAISTTMAIAIFLNMVHLRFFISSPMPDHSSGFSFLGPIPEKNAARRKRPGFQELQFEPVVEALEQG